MAAVLSSKKYTAVLRLKKIWIILVLFLLLFPVAMEVIKVFSQAKNLNINNKNLAVEGRAKNIINILKIDKKLSGKYDKSLSNLMFAQPGNFEDFQNKLEKTYFGRILRPSDFIYETNSNGYKLCFDQQGINKCWDNNFNK